MLYLNLGVVELFCERTDRRTWGGYLEVRRESERDWVAHVGRRLRIVCST